MEQERREGGGRIRRKGRAHFILVRGGIMLALPLGVIWNLCEWLSAGSYFRDPYSSLDKRLFMLGGFFRG